FYSGRQTNIGTDELTGRGRTFLWASGLQCLVEYPFFGIGYDQFEDYAGQVAHNAFIHCFAELGFVGGAMFLGAFTFGGISVCRFKARQRVVSDPSLDRLSPYFISAVAGYASNLFFLSDAYLVPTFMVLGLLTVYSNLLR